jgi:EAL domain-containing protein (putative c-di-GMP-specific phosphodiesterase class I)
VKQWRLLGGTEAFFVSLNISPRQLHQGGLYDMVMETLSDHDLEPSALQLELTESALLESSEPNVDTLRRLFQDGVRVALDDFGTGYSSLMYLKRFPLHGIKIDKSFVQRLPSDTGNAAIASGLIAMAQSLKLRVTAEGVETPEQLRFLCAQGCDEAQGYLLSKPLEVEQVEPLLLDREHAARILGQAAPSARGLTSA